MNLSEINDRTGLSFEMIEWADSPTTEMCETLSVLAERGYVYLFEREHYSNMLVNVDTDASILASLDTDGEMNLSLWDDFYNYFSLGDFDNLDDYIDAVLERFNDLWTYFIDNPEA